MMSLYRKGYEDLWGWFGLTRASWVTMPRIMMHEMPDEWQEQMAVLLNQWDETWDTSHLPSTRVQAVGLDSKITRFPGWLLNYRHPDKDEINNIKAAQYDR